MDGVTEQGVICAVKLKGRMVPEDAVGLLIPGHDVDPERGFTDPAAVREASEQAPGRARTIAVVHGFGEPGAAEYPADLQEAVRTLLRFHGHRDLRSCGETTRFQPSTHYLTPRKYVRRSLELPQVPAWSWRGSLYR